MKILENYSEFTNSHYWFGELNKVTQLEQRKDSLSDQMRDLFVIANKFGLYRASNYIRDNVFFKEHSDIENQKHIEHAKKFKAQSNRQVSVTGNSS